MKLLMSSFQWYPTLIPHQAICWRNCQCSSQDQSQLSAWFGTFWANSGDPTVRLVGPSSSWWGPQKRPAPGWKFFFLPRGQRGRVTVRFGAHMAKKTKFPKTPRFLHFLGYLRQVSRTADILAFGISEFRFPISEHFSNVHEKSMVTGQ